MRAVVLLALAGMGARNTFAQSATTAPAPVLTLQLAPPAPPEGRPAVSAKAATAYRRGVAALHKGKNAHAERDARRALRLAPSFAEAWALAATASLAQRDFKSATQQAATAVRLAPGMEAAWILLATAENHRGQYAEAMRALQHLPFTGNDPWQADYQRARAAAGLREGPAVLAYTNRAALAAPQAFAPLHLLRASAMADQGEYKNAAEELTLYIQLAGDRSPDHAALQQEVARLRALTQPKSADLAGK